MSSRSMATVLGFVLLLAVEASAQETWDKDLGKPAPRLFPAGWVGTPVSLDALRKSDRGVEDPSAGATVTRGPQVSGGNTVVLAFWNADIPC